MIGAVNGVTGILSPPGGNPLEIPSIPTSNSLEQSYNDTTKTGLAIGTIVAGGAVGAESSLSVVPEGQVSATTGSYLHTFESGNFYAGKGPISRMNRTGSSLSRTYNDPLVSSEFFPASSNRAAFMNEHRIMMQNGGPLSFNPLSPTYNKIFSPGRRFF